MTGIDWLAAHASARFAGVRLQRHGPERPGGGIVLGGHCHGGYLARRPHLRCVRVASAAWRMAGVCLLTRSVPLLSVALTVAAYAYYTSPMEAEAAVKALHGRPVSNRPIHVMGLAKLARFLVRACAAEQSHANLDLRRAADRLPPTHVASPLRHRLPRARTRRLCSCTNCRRTCRRTMCLRRSGSSPRRGPRAS